MESFERIEAIAAPLLRINIDTDQIIPARFLVRMSNDGLGEGLFADWRLDADGSPRPEFVLNRAPYDRAQVLLAGRNFGCGSSREPAPIALRQRGIRVVIAPSFGGIFYSNCFRNGVLPVELPDADVRALADEVERHGGLRPLAVDLRARTVTSPDGRVLPFVVPARLRAMLLEGLDEVGWTLSRGERIEAFRAADRVRRPWAYRHGGAVG